MLTECPCHACWTQASFQLQLEVPASLTALSNMPVQSVQPASAAADAYGPRQLVTFAPTPRMSPYLFALAVGSLTGLSATANGRNISVWMPSHLNATEMLTIPLQVATAAYSFYETYTGMAQPSQMGKFDLVAVPGKWGAMENYGERAPLCGHGQGRDARGRVSTLLHGTGPLAGSR